MSQSLFQPWALARIETAGHTSILDQEINGRECEVEGYWADVAGRSWMDCKGNPACLKYAMRSGFNGLPTDNRVLYVKVGRIGHLVHESELRPHEVTNQ